MLQTIPGVGPVISALMISTIIDPNRFPDKRKLWKYAGLGVRRCWTSDPKYAKTGGSKSGNRVLKYAAMEAAILCKIGDNSLHRQWNKLVDDGLKPAMAQRTVARKILVIAWKMWKNGEVYCEPKE